MGDSSTYKEAFYACKDSLPEDLKYHNRLSNLQKDDAKVREHISECKAEMEAEELENTDLPADGPLHYVCTEAHDAMAELGGLMEHSNQTDIDTMVTQLNNDQLRVFNKISSSTEIVRLFVSGFRSTG